jgi:Tfp pilus assembly protein PilP
MNMKRTATIVVVGAALLAWLAGAATSNHTIPPVIVNQPAPIEARGAELATEIARLQERLRPSATPRQPGRNLFAFRAIAARRPAPNVPVSAASAMPALSESLPLAPALPALKLAGIAEDAGTDGPVRTAIISGEGQLYMAKEGENVTSRYRVVRISPDVVELLDVIDNSTRRLALR